MSVVMCGGRYCTLNWFAFCFFLLQCTAIIDIAHGFYVVLDKKTFSGYDSPKASHKLVDYSHFNFIIINLIHFDSAPTFKTSGVNQLI